MRAARLQLLLLISFSVSVFSSNALAGNGKTFVTDTVTYVSPFAEENERCFICHGQSRYDYNNESLGTTIKALMCTDRITKRADFYASNHKSFSCTDCHSEEYSTFPHSGELRMEMKYGCMDCHGGDPTFAAFHFDEIDVEYRNSTHFKLEEEGFTCWKCHDPHTYKISIRNTENLKETILYDNAICLNCHSDYDRYQLLSDREEINIIKQHDWLPNQASHFRSVRCIECHTMLSDSILVAHMILPKEQAVKGCNECHSKNSILMASLYKFQSKEQRRDGFFNGIILNESYVIGANRNEYLNILSIVLFGIVLVIIGMHIIFRIVNK
jgi:hypothetical protein